VAGEDSIARGDRTNILLVFKKSLLGACKIMIDWGRTGSPSKESNWVKPFPGPLPTAPDGGRAHLLQSGLSAHPKVGQC